MPTSWATNPRLANSVHLALTRKQILKLDSRWNESRGGLHLRLWTDIELLAGHFWFVSGQGGPGEAFAWDHLLLAVGNFKRGRRSIEPIQGGLTGVTVGAPQDTLQIPSIDVTVNRLTLVTWQQLEQLTGIKAPTATTLLSALWPGEHVILDRRDLRAAVALLAFQGHAIAGPHDPATTTWDEYAWFLRVVRNTATARRVQPVQVERALYVLYGNVDFRKGETWAAYGNRFIGTL